MHRQDRVPQPHKVFRDVEVNWPCWSDIFRMSAEHDDFRVDDRIVASGYRVRVDSLAVGSLEACNTSSASLLQLWGGGTDLR